ncbi:MAG: ATP-binding protein [Nitriliruptorales bacterium]|nr:ATP-binding protein [Nitriliruptorales bacterium]
MGRGTWQAAAGLLVLAVLFGPAAGLAAAQEPPEQLSPELRSWLEGHGPLRVGWSAALRPVSIIENGRVTGGYAVDAWDLAAIRLRVELEHVAYPDTESLGAALDDGEIDVAGGLGFHPAVAEGRQASEPYAWVPAVFVGRPEQAALGIDDLSGRTFTTLPGAVIRAEVLEQFPGGTYVPTEGAVAGLEAVAAGEIDLYFGPLALLGHQLSRLDLDLVTVGEYGELNTVQSWADPGSEAAAIAEAIRASLTESDLSTLHVLWTGYDLTEPGRTLPTWFAPVLAGGLVVLALATLISIREIRNRRRLARLNAELHRSRASLAAANEELSRSNEELERFAAVASHDLQEPLRMVASYTELLARDYGDELGEEARELMDYAVDGARRMRTLITDLLQYSRLRTRAEDHVPVDLNDAVTDALRDLRLAIEEADALVEVGDLPTVRGEPAQLRLLFQNLIGNAVKYRSDAQPRVTVQGEPDGDGWKLQVSDNGIGIPPDRREEIFEPFRRLHGRSDYPGTGIGLAICRRIVERHGGRIWVEPNEPRGSRFVFTLADGRENRR